MTRRYAAPTQLGRRGSRAAQFFTKRTDSIVSAANVQHTYTRTSNYSARELSSIKLCNFTSNYFSEFGETGLELFKFRRIFRRNTVMIIDPASHALSQAYPYQQQTCGWWEITSGGRSPSGWAWLGSGPRGRDHLLGYHAAFVHLDNLRVFPREEKTEEIYTVAGFLSRVTTASGAATP